MLFTDLSPLVLTTFGFVLCLICVWIFIRVRRYMAVQLIPFKKGQRYWCKVIAVSDGDTITCQRLNLRRSQSKMRFAYIDAPESKQAYGAEATKLLCSLVLNKWVRIEIADTDRYGRHVSIVYRRGKNINQELIKRGAAWVYEDYIRDQTLKKQLLDLQATAKAKKRGLWQATRPVNPSIYRKSS